MKAKTPKTIPASTPDSNPVELPDVEPAATSTSEPLDDAYEQLLRIRAELGEEEGKVILKRRNSKGQIGALGVMAAVDFSIERVIQDWGGGRYVAVIYKGADKLDQITFDVDESIPTRVPKDVKEEVQPKAGMPMQPTYQEDPRIAELSRAIASTNEMMKLLIATMVQKGQQAQAGGDGALAIGLKIAEMVTNKNPGPSFTDLKDIFLAGLEAREAAEHEDEGFMGVVKAFADPIGKLVTKATGAPGTQPVVTGAAPMQPPPTQAALPEGGPTWLIHLRPHLPQILQWARMGKDPELYAEVILDNMDPGAQIQVGQEAKDPNFVSKTLAALPMFAPYSAWATAVLTNIKDLLTEEEPKDGSDPEEEETVITPS